MVDLSSFGSAFLFVQNNSYFILFLIMVVEGPIITTASSFAASLGYFNVWIIALLSFLGEVVGDSFVYAFGYFGRNKFIKNYGSLFGLKMHHLYRIENHFENHLGKTLFFLKMTPLAVPGLMLAGASHVPLKKYAYWDFLIIVIQVLFFTGLGYFFGFLSGSVLKVYKSVGLYFAILVVIVIFVYWLGKFLSEKVMKSRF